MGLKKHFKLTGLAIKNIATGKKVRFKQGMALATTIIVVVAATGSTIYVRGVFIKAKAYSDLKNSRVETVTSNVTTTTSITDTRKKEALRDLKKAKEHMSSLGKIELFRDDIMVTHNADYETGTGLNKRSAIIEKEAPAKYASYIDSSEIEWKVSEDGLTLEAYIGRPTIKKEDIERDTSVKPIVIKHPEPGMVDKLANKNGLIKAFKRTFANDAVKGYITTEECHDLELKWDLTFTDKAYKVIKDEVLGDDKFMKELEDIAISVITNIYNPDIDATKITDENNVVKKYHKPLNTPVKVYYKK